MKPSKSPLARHAQSYFESIAHVVETGIPPTPEEIESHYSLQGRKVEGVQDLFKDLAASAAATATDLEAEVDQPERLTLVGRLSNDSKCRFEFQATKESPPKIEHFRYVAPLPDYEDEFVEGDEAQILVRRYGGGRTPALLLHGGYMDVNEWDFLAPLLLPEISPVALDLRGHGRSDTSLAFSMEGALRDIASVARALDCPSPVLVGHSLGGHVALEFVTANQSGALIALDGPTSFELTTTNEEIEKTDEPGRSFLPEVKRQDVRRLLDRMNVPAMFVFATGSTPDDRKLMFAPRQELANYIDAIHPSVRVEWLEADHMIPLSVPEDAASPVKDFINGLDGKK